MNNFNSAEEASQKAKVWCEKKEGWKRICDIENVESLYFTWEELPKKTKETWVFEYGENAKNAWMEFGISECKVKHGFISDSGEFFTDITKVSVTKGVMSVLKVS